MRGDSSATKVLRPKSAREAVSAFARCPQALPLAGGTDVMVSWNMGALNGRTMLDLSRVAEWRRIEILPDRARIGSLATHAQIQEHPVLRVKFPLLAQACATVGAEQIQNRGTLGGNIANASPAGDTFPALAVYDADVRAVSKNGRRTVPVLKVFAGVKKTALAPGELIEAVELPFLRRPPERAVFRKVGQRAAQTISKAVAAGLLWLKDSSVEEVRFALGSVAPTVRRLKTAELHLTGKRLTPELAEEACAFLAHDISPIDDIRSTAEYRLTVCQNILRNFLG